MISNAVICNLLIVGVTLNTSIILTFVKYLLHYKLFIITQYYIYIYINKVN